ncbi:MAG: bifunctional hydroxymethylpyrimidine kinase/phosphomethylpyrimidine kinase [Myxococcota bacterium]
MQPPRHPSPTIPCALTIAGSDSGGGAGIQADLKTFAALGVYGASAITAVTAQNTRGVTRWRGLPASFVCEQAEVVLDDVPIGAMKTGMLGTAAVIRGVAKLAARHPNIPLVVDPVMVATSGDPLLAPDAERALRRHLLPRAHLVTPNLPEAARLLGHPVHTVTDMREAAAELVSLGAQAALVKGGHSDGDPIDILCFAGGVLELSLPRLQTTSTHGTGCTLSAAVAAHLARGRSLDDAVRAAHAYVHEAIRQAPGLGGGHGPVHHFHPFYGPRGLA